MGKFVLTIGLVKGDEHLCNTCYLFDREMGMGECGAKVKVALFPEIKEGDVRALYPRPKECPLIAVDKWPDEVEESGGVTLC
jgi:hypothetical protein